MPDGITVEVRISTSVQTWHQARHNGRAGGAPTPAPGAGQHGALIAVCQQRVMCLPLESQPIRHILPEALRVANMSSSIETVQAILEGMRRGRKPNQLALDFLAAHDYASRIYNGGLYKIVDSLLDVEGTSEALRRLGSGELAREVVSVLAVIGVQPGTWQETLAKKRDHRGWQRKVFRKLDYIRTDLPERIWTLLSVIAAREPDLWEDGPNAIHPT